LHKQLRDHPDAIITGKVETTGDSEGVIVVDSNKSAIQRRPRIKFDAMSGGNMGTSVSVIERVGLFDEDVRLQTSEDCEWSYRALRSGVSIIYTPEVSVRHYVWRDEHKRANQYRSYALSHGGFYGKYLRKGDLFILLRAVVHYFRALRRWIRGVITGDQELTLCERAYLTGLLPGIIAGMQKNRK
jgi:GT2 family glycosyltransferase